MSFSLLPKKVKFYEMFKEQSQNLIEASELLHTIFSDFSNIGYQCNKINMIERRGLEISREISRQNSLTFITPIDKEDIHKLNSAQEQLLRCFKELSRRLALWGFKSFEKSAIELTHDLNEIIKEVDSMMINFINNKPFAENVNRIKKLLEQSDSFLVLMYGELFEENVPNPKHVFELTKLIQIYDRLENALEDVDNLANIIEGICLKYA